MHDIYAKTRENLKVLSIFYYVSAGLSTFGSCFGLIYVVIGGLAGAAMSAAPQGGPPGGPKGPPPEAGLVFGGIFVVIGGFIMLMALGHALLSFLTARKLTSHTGHTFCMVTAVLHCLQVPLGTVLGVFTLVILSKPETKQLFGLEPMQEPMPAWDVNAPPAPGAAPPTQRM